MLIGWVLRILARSHNQTSRRYGTYAIFSALVLGVDVIHLERARLHKRSSARAMIRRSLVVHLLASLIVPCLSGSLAASECPTGNLLEGLEPLDAPPVVHLDRLADGIVVEEGGDWGSTTSAMVLRDEPLVFDLGRVLSVGAIFVQGDHAGSYRLRGLP